MRDIVCICDTSPIQYLHQLSMLDLLPQLVGSVKVPPAVVAELAVGRDAGVSLPDLNSLSWLEVHQPHRTQQGRWINDLGAGEAEVLMLGLEIGKSIVVLDDALAREVAASLGLNFTGTLGLLLDAKRSGHISAVGPVLNQLDSLHFRISKDTRRAVLQLAGEVA